jgi:tRNA (cmo5U34)-methyltransferase
MAKNAQLWETQEIADKYLSGVRGAIPLAAEQTEVMLRLIKAAKVKVDSLLDIGCGDGILAATILEHFPDAKAVLIYNSEPMIQEAQQKLNKYKNTEFIVCDYGNKDWLSKLTNSAPFDIIVSGFSIHHQPDIRKRELYEEFYKMLKKKWTFYKY